MKESHFRTFCANFAIAVTLICTFGVAFVFAIPKEDDAIVTNNAIYGGEQSGNKVALMFNVYEGEENMLKIAQIFKDFGMSCTFFIGGSFAAKHQGAILRIAAADFEMGNHGYLHRDHSSLSYKQNIDEITLCERLLTSIIADLPSPKLSKLFAPPSGSLGNAMFKACDTLGYKVIMWTRDTVDWRDHDRDLIFTRATNGIKAGDLVLMHPTDDTVLALPRILSLIKEQNLTAATVSEVLA